MTERRTIAKIALAARTGACQGAIVWGLYGLAEFCFDSVIPFWYERSHVLTGWQWMIGGVLLLCYLMLGLLGGGAAGAAAGAMGWPPALARPASALLLIASVGGQVFYRGISPAGRDIVLVCLAAGCLQLVALIPRWRDGLLRWTVHPVVVAALLAGFPVWRVAPDLPEDTSVLSAASRAGGDKPNVVMVIMDTVRADHTSVHGYERDTTPALRELAGQATVYQRAIAAGNFSLTGHGALLTGSYPRRSGAHRSRSANGALHPRLKTIAEYMVEQGYSTLLCNSNHAFFTDYYGMMQGFQTYRTPDLVAIPYHLRRVFRQLFRYTRFWELHRKFSSAGTINELIYDELEDLDDSGSPFFLVVNYMDAHTPLVAPRPFTDIYLEEDKLMTDVRMREIAHRLRHQSKNATPEELEIISAQYDAGIRYADEKIGELIAHLKRAGQFDNTLFIVTSDHGNTNMERGHVGHGGDLCELEIRIPLVVKYPRQSEPRVVRTYANHVDMLPTILDVAGGEAPVDIDGVSLARLGDDEERMVVAEDFGRQGVARAFYSGDWKLMTNADGTFQLFKITEDPDEEHDLFAAEPAKAAELMAAVDAWLAATPKFVTTAGEVDENELERLKGLGYVQ
jgi:arylsulfatase A-like enzyme